MANTDITSDWYKNEFLQQDLPVAEIAINAGLNKKTISNMYNSATKRTVLTAANTHYERLAAEIKQLVDTQDQLDLNLTIRLGEVNVDLNTNESLMVINTIAVKRSQIRGSAWSKIGKSVEKLLMLSLCAMHSVSQEHFSPVAAEPGKIENGIKREVDFYLKSKQKLHSCEVKLMGKGNPESADAVIARDAAVFIADKLSDLNKRQLSERGVLWVELRGGKGPDYFAEVLTKLAIPHKKPRDIKEKLEQVLTKVVK